MSAEVATKPITLTITSTEGVTDKVIEFTGTTWKELKEVLRRTWNIDNMKVIESTRRASLEHPTALIAQEDHMIFLIPIKNKSGAASKGGKKAPKKAVKKAAPKKAAKKATKKAAPKKAAKKAAPKKKNVADVVQSVAESKARLTDKYVANKADMELIRGGLQGVK